MLYRQVAWLIKNQINKKTLAGGDRLPSLRQLSSQLNVSMGTVQRAYIDLEDQGLISVKRRSGYYVKTMLPALSGCHGKGRSKSEPSRVQVMETAMAVMRSARNQKMIQMGSAVPNTRGRAVAKLHQAIKRHALKVPNYEADAEGYLPLRRQLAKRSWLTGSIFHPDEIVITSGAQEALTIALRAIARAEDVIAVESPCYYGVLLALEVLNLKALEIPVSPGKGMDINQLEAALANWPVKGIVLNPAFSNPSGYLLSDANKKKLADLTVKYDVPIIEDDLFADLGYQGNRPRTIRSFDRGGRVITCGSISKCLSPDLRIGWILPGRYADQVKRLKFISSLCNPLLQQYALAEFLDGNEYERHLRTVTEIYRRNQALLIKAIKTHMPAQTLATRPDGGFLCWMKLPEGKDGFALYQRALKEGICLTPGNIFSPTGRYHNHVRINYALATKNELESAVRIMAKIIR